jgi:hypothetical protein
MFKIPLLDRSSIVSDEGFRVTYDRFWLKYEEGEYSLTINIEQGAGVTQIYEGSAKCWNESPSTPLDSPTRKKYWTTSAEL